MAKDVRIAGPMFVRPTFFVVFFELGYWYKCSAFSTWKPTGASTCTQIPLHFPLESMTWTDMFWIVEMFFEPRHFCGNKTASFSCIRDRLPIGKESWILEQVHAAPRGSEGFLGYKNVGFCGCFWMFYSMFWWWWSPETSRQEGIFWRSWAPINICQLCLQLMQMGSHCYAYYFCHDKYPFTALHSSIYFFCRCKRLCAPNSSTRVLLRWKGFFEVSFNLQEDMFFLQSWKERWKERPSFFFLFEKVSGCCL